MAAIVVVGEMRVSLRSVYTSREVLPNSAVPDTSKMEAESEAARQKLRTLSQQHGLADILMQLEDDVDDKDQEIAELKFQLKKDKKHREEALEKAVHEKQLREEALAKEALAKEALTKVVQEKQLLDAAVSENAETKAKLKQDAKHREQALEKLANEKAMLVAELDKALAQNVQNLEADAQALAEKEDEKVEQSIRAEELEVRVVELEMELKRALKDTKSRREAEPTPQRTAC